MPPRGNNTERMQLCGLSKARPISCSDSPAVQRLQTSRFSIEESPSLIPRLMPTPPLQSRFTLDGVESTYRMHSPNRTMNPTSPASKLGVSAVDSEGAGTAARARFINTEKHKYKLTLIRVQRSLPCAFVSA